MLNNRIINTGGAGAACTTDTTQILDAGLTQSTALYRFEDNANDTAYTAGSIVTSNRVIDLNVNGYSSGTTINDSTSNYNNATIVGNVTYSNPSGSNGRFNLDGASDYLQIGASATFNSAANFTVEGWFKPDNLTAVDHFFTIWGANNGPNNKFYLRLNDADGDIDAYTYTSTGGTSAQLVTNNASVRVQAGVFNHIVMTYTDGGSGSIAVYINGALAGSATPSAAVNTTGTEDLYIGTLKTYIGSYDFDGEVGQIRFYNSALTAAEVLQNYNATRALYGAHDGTASNITYTTGKFGKAAVFNGTDSVIDIPKMRTVMNNDFAVSFWHKTPSTFVTSGYPALISMYGYLGYGSAYGWDIEYATHIGSGDKLTFYWVSSSGVGNYIYSNSLSADTWYHIVCQKNASSAAIYVNGVSENSGSSISSYAMYYNNFNRMTIGAKRLNYGSTSSHVSGLIDQVRLFTKQLSAGEINSLYNETATSAASATIENPTTVAYYKMDDASDETGSYNGTASNVDFNVQGKYGFAGKFNGSNAYIDLGNTIATSTRAISMWVNADDFSERWPFQQGDGQGIENYIRFYNTDDIQVRWGNVTQTFSGYSANTWYHIVAQKDENNNANVWINGVEMGSTGSPSSITVNKTNIGRRYNNGAYQYYFKGKIDQVRIFNKAISAAEVTTLYNEVQCANTITAPENYFQTKLYTGNNSTQSITGLGFQPDLIWFKNRTGTNSHAIVDSVRGRAKSIYPDANFVENTSAASNDLVSFDNNGFTVGSVSQSGSINTNGGSIVSWNWKAASSNTTNNDGTIASTVRASQESGFSIITYNPNDTVGMSIGHGLSKSPSLVITKRLDVAQDWGVYTNVSTGNTTTNWLSLNDADPYGTGSYMTIKSTTLELPQTGAFWSQGNSQVAYCFANIDGYQRIGSYIGTGTPENFIYTGFEPAWVLIKNTGTSSTNWVIVDNKRDNADEWLYPNSNAAAYDDANTYTRFYENGFSVANNGSYVNTSGDSYIFLAVAENPDTTAPTKANSFKTKIYTGNGSTRSITDIGFKPDFTWIKKRANDTKAHRLFDSVRGANNVIYSNLTNVAATPTDELTAFIDGGFSLGNASAVNDGASDTYVAWSWKGLDHDRNLATINNDGSIPSIVSANPAAGFSVVKWTGTGVDGTKIGHGLQGSPEMIITKGLSNATSWVIGVGNISGLSINDYFTFTGYAKANSSTFYQAYSTNTFQVGVSAANEMNKSSSNQYISYCFRTIAGHSKIGKYTGTGVSGLEIALDFSPSFLLVKGAGATGWIIIDNQRPTPGGNYELYANLSNIEDTSATSFLLGTNKFTVNSTGTWHNTNGTDYIYLAIK